VGVPAELVLQRRGGRAIWRREIIQAKSPGEGRAVLRLGVLFCALLFCLGCSAGGQRGQWDDFWKDLRGDNMKMRSDFGGTSLGEGPSLRSHD
jgi:hypothetical protein